MKGAVDSQAGIASLPATRMPITRPTVALVRATPEKHDEIARFPVLDGKTWSHPAMADGYLLIRNVNEMAAFDLRTDRR